jgi:E1A/CREB-binding protein
MWMLLQVHAKQCQNAECPVPRCRELREMRRRSVARQEDQRRVAYKAMLRAQNAQRAGSLPGGGQGGQGGANGMLGGGQQEVKREAQY